MEGPVDTNGCFAYYANAVVSTIPPSHEGKKNLLVFDKIPPPDEVPNDVQDDRSFKRHMNLQSL